MSDEDVFQVSRVTTSLRIEVCTTIAQTTTTDNLHHSLNQFIVVDRELVSIPSVLVVTTVGIDRTQHVVVYSYCQFVFKCVTSQSSVVYFDIYFEVFVQTVCFQEADNSFSIYVVLVLAWFHRFRFNQESTLETFATCIVTSQFQHLSQVFFFTFLVSVQQ